MEDEPYRSILTITHFKDGIDIKEKFAGFPDPINIGRYGGYDHNKYFEDMRKFCLTKLTGKQLNPLDLGTIRSWDDKEEF